MRTTDVNNMAGDTIEQAEQTRCYHCGEQCPDLSLHIDDKYFCCQGCKVVYQMLSESDLTCYYGIEQHPGVTAREPADDARFAWLDEAEVSAKILDFADGERAKTTFHIPLMHCSACIWLLENLYKLDDGIVVSQVNFPRKELALTFNPQKTTLRRIVTLLAAIGYEPQITLNDVAGHKERDSRKSLYMKLGVAGFAMGNIMLLSLPEYLAWQMELPEHFKRFFGYLNLLLALPVLLYSSTDYFNSALTGLRQRMLTIDVPIVIGILALFFRSSYDILTGSGAGYMDSLAAFVFFLLLGRLFQQKTYETLSFERDYKSYFPVSVTRLEREGEKVISISRLQVGDILLVHNHEIIPADAVLLSDTCEIDYSFVTGEARTVGKRNGDLLFAGGRIVGQAAKIQIIKKVSQSYLTQLWNNDVFQGKKKSRLKSISDRVAQNFTLAVLFIALAAAAYWARVDYRNAVDVFTAVLVIACPCALALSIPFSLGNALRIFGRNKFYLKNSDTVERLAGIDSIVFDKTGTLTEQGEQEMHFLRLDGRGDRLRDEEAELIAAVTRHSTHPLSRKIRSLLAGREQELQPVAHLTETEGSGLSGHVSGHEVRIGSASWTGAGAELTEKIRGQNGSRVFVAIDGTVIGVFLIHQAFRSGMHEQIRHLQQQYPVQLLSGDNDSSREDFERIFGHNSVLHFNQSPEQKLNFIRSLQQDGHFVMMVGDGLNDAGALKQSDVGVAIAENTSAFSPACDGILEAGSFRHLSTFLKFARKTVHVVYISFGVSFFYNIIGLSFAVTGNLAPVVAAILMPLSSISVVAFTTLATGALAKKYGI